jgi:hypothetical protein
VEPLSFWALGDAWTVLVTRFICFGQAESAICGTELSNCHHAPANRKLQVLLRTYGKI